MDAGAHDQGMAEAGAQRCERCPELMDPKHGRRLCTKCSPPRGYRLPTGSAAPCGRCGDLYERKQGRRFCDRCSRGKKPSKRFSERLKTEGVEGLLRDVGCGECLPTAAIAAALGVSRRCVELDLLSAFRKLSDNPLVRELAGFQR